jgi:prevent-host-death family protein
MTKVDSAEAQASFPELLAHIGEGGDRVVIEKEGQAIAVIISYAELKRLEAGEKARDSAIAGHIVSGCIGMI